MSGEFLRHWRFPSIPWRLCELPDGPPPIQSADALTGHRVCGLVPTQVERNHGEPNGIGPWHVFGPRGSLVLAQPPGSAKGLTMRKGGPLVWPRPDGTRKLRMLQWAMCNGNARVERDVCGKRCAGQSALPAGD